MSIKKIIREEIESGIKDSNEEDWEWAKDSNTPYEEVNTKEDHIGIWSYLTEAFVSCTDDLEGEVSSNDYLGKAWVDVYSPSKPEIGIYIDIDFRYEEETDGMWIDFKIRTVEDDYDSIIGSGSYEYVRFTLKPIVTIIKTYYGC